MTILYHTEALKTLCKLSGKWGILIEVGDYGSIDGLLKAAPCLGRLEEDDGHAALQLVMDRSGFLLFDTEADMEAAYGSIVGDDGPTETNPYDGPERVYALTCGPDGQTLNENT